LKLSQLQYVHINAVKISKTFFATILIVLVCCAVHAQPLQPLAPGQSGLSFSSTATGSGKASLQDGRTTYDDIRVTNFSLATHQRVAIGNRRTLAFGLDYDVTDIDSPNPAPLPLPDRLQSVGTSLRYFQPFDQQWMLSASVGAGSYVADSRLLSEGWGARASIVGIYNRSRELTFMFGVAYNSLSSDLRILPVFGLDWRPTEKWSLAIGFPRTGVTYKVNKAVALSLAASGSGGAYQVKNDPLPGIAPRSLADSKLQYLEVRLGFNADWKIDDTFRISGMVGQVLYRQFKYIDRDYKLKSHGTAPFLSLSGTISL
jgi:hypothetical protein